MSSKFITTIIYVLCIASAIKANVDHDLINLESNYIKTRFNNKPVITYEKFDKLSDVNKEMYANDLKKSQSMLLEENNNDNAEHKIDGKVKRGEYSEIRDKRQIPGSGDNQMIIGTFQAIVRPMNFAVNQNAPDSATNTTESDVHLGMKGCLECPPGSALAITLHISRYAGVAPVTFTSNGLRFSRPLSFYSYFVATVISCVILVGFAFDMLTEPKRSVRVRTTTSRVIWIANFTIIILITSIAAYKAPSRMRCMIKCLNQIQKIKLFLNDENVNNSRGRFEIAMVVIVSAVLWFLICCDFYGFMSDALSHGREVRTLIMYSFLFYEYYLDILVKFQFSLLTLKLLSALKLVNAGLKNLVNAWITQRKSNGFLYSFCTENVTNTTNTRVNNFMFKAAPVVPNKAINVLIDFLAAGKFDHESQHYNGEKRSAHDLCDAYGAICDILRKIDKEHGLLLLLILIAFFLQLIITPYYLITALFTFSELLNILLQVSWLFYHIINILMVVEPCYEIQKEMENTQTIVCNLMRLVPLSDPMFGDVFWKQLLLDRPAFTPLGLCTLSRPLSVTILGAVTTYLVIIFQFRSYDADY